MSNPRSDAVTLCSQIISTTCPKNCAPTIIAGRKKLYIANADFPSDAFSPALKIRRHVLLARPVAKKYVGSENGPEKRT